MGELLGASESNKGMILGAATDVVRGAWINLVTSLCCRRVRWLCKGVFFFCSRGTLLAVAQSDSGSTIINRRIAILSIGLLRNRFCNSFCIYHNRRKLFESIRSTPCGRLAKPTFYILLSVVSPSNDHGLEMMSTLYCLHRLIPAKLQ